MDRWNGGGRARGKGGGGGGVGGWRDDEREKPRKRASRMGLRAPANGSIHTRTLSFLFCLHAHLFTAKPINAQNGIGLFDTLSPFPSSSPLPPVPQIKLLSAAPFNLWVEASPHPIRPHPLWYRWLLAMSEDDAALTGFLSTLCV